jgi:CRP-like cAMP-binding protein
MLITGNPQLALILLKLFCKRIYDQKRRLKILVIADPQARLADVFCMFNEMNPVPVSADRRRKFNVTESDIVHWSGLPQNIVRDEMKHFTMSRKVEIFDNYMVVNNIADMQRIVDSRTNSKK